MGLEVAYLPGFAVAIDAAPSRHHKASLAYNIALLPGFAIYVCFAVTRGRSAHVGDRATVLENRFALDI